MHTRVILCIVIAAALGAGQADARDRGPRDRGTPERAEARDQGRNQGRNEREEQVERTTRTLKLGANGEILLGNIAGDISIVRGGGRDATLEIVKTARGRSVEEARDMLGLVQVDITERGGRAEVKTRYPQGDAWRQNRRNINVSVALSLTAPEATAVSARSISGSISAKDIKGDVALESVSGSVRISNGGRVAAAKSISGDVEITDTEIEGRLDASSVSGTVLLRNVKARSLEAASVSGEVIVQDVACDRIEAQTVSGDVEFSGPLARGGRYEFSSHSGGVQVAISGSSGFELEATSFSGSVRSEISLTSQASDTGRGHQRTLRGVFGDGSAVLDLTTFSGSIVIRKR